MKLTEEEIEAGRSQAGGYTKAQLARWGVPWPPPKGWKEALLAGTPMEREVQPSAVRPTMDANDLLRQVVLAVVEKGHASDLYGFPDVLAYFGAQVPANHEAAKHRIVSDTELPGAPF
jgi:hypothetical protein